MEKNKIYRLKEVFDQLSVGQRIVTNGDDISAQPDFFSGVIVAIHDNTLFITRDDGEQGGGDNDEWTIINDPESTADVIDLDRERYTSKGHRQLQFGDVIEWRNISGVTAVMMVLQRLGHNKVYAKGLFETPGRDTRAEILIIGENEVRFFFKIDKVPCSEYGCEHQAVKAVNGMAYCETHLRARGNVVACHDCGTEIFENESYDVPSRRNEIRLRSSSRRICASCRQERINAARVIHEYSYKPSPLFIMVDPVDSSLPLKIFEGLEQEVECPRSGGEDDYDPDDDELQDNHPTAKFGRKVIKQFFEPKKWFYLKRDGSLTNGFELVTHPATLNGHYELPWEKLCAYYKRLGIDADGTATCGLHIHTNKDIMDNDHRIRLAYFVASNKANMEKLARRPACHWAAYKNMNSALADLARSSGKYEALNWSPPHTVEFRLFKGTVDYKNVMSSIELVHAAVTYTAAVSLDFLKDTRKAWPGFMKHVAEHGYKFLPDYLKARGTV